MKRNVQSTLDVSICGEKIEFNTRRNDKNTKILWKKQCYVLSNLSTVPLNISVWCLSILIFFFTPPRNCMYFDSLVDYRFSLFFLKCCFSSIFVFAKGQMVLQPPAYSEEWHFLEKSKEFKFLANQVESAAIYGSNHENMHIFLLLALHCSPFKLLLVIF